MNKLLFRVDFTKLLHRLRKFYKIIFGSLNFFSFSYGRSRFPHRKCGPLIIMSFKVTISEVNLEI